VSPPIHDSFCWDRRTLKRGTLHRKKLGTKGLNFSERFGDAGPAGAIFEKFGGDLISGKISGERHDPAPRPASPTVTRPARIAPRSPPRRTELNGLFCGHTSARNYGVRNRVARTLSSAHN